MNYEAIIISIARGTITRALSSPSPSHPPIRARLRPTFQSHAHQPISRPSPLILTIHLITTSPRPSLGHTLLNVPHGFRYAHFAKIESFRLAFERVPAQSFLSILCATPIGPSSIQYLYFSRPLETKGKILLYYPYLFIWDYLRPPHTHPNANIRDSKSLQPLTSLPQLPHTKAPTCLGHNSPPPPSPSLI